MKDYHRAVIGDERRVALLDRAIQQVVRPGDVVVDVGTGTGILACLACRAGAGHVYAIERTSMAQVAAEVVRANGFADRVTCLEADARWVELPRSVDVILGDVLGVAGIEDDIVAITAALAKRHLRDGGRVMPRSLEVFAAPWEAKEAHEHVAFWDRDHQGLDFGPVRAIARNTLRSVRAPRDGALAPAARCFDFELGAPSPDPMESTVSFAVTRSGTFHGLVVWFRAELTDDLELATSPEDPETVWRQGFLPVETPCEVLPGDAIGATIVGTPGEERLLLGWRGRVTRGDRELARFEGHMFGSEPVSLRAVELLRRDRVPRSSQEGTAVAWVLARLDGSTSPAALARDLRAHMPDLFSTDDVAQRFIARLVARFGAD